MPDRLTIVTCYYDQPWMLQQQQRTVENYPDWVKARLKLIVVDDGSPGLPAKDAALQAFGYVLEIYRVGEDRPWHHLGARNLGMYVAPEGWCLMIDLDHTLPAESAEALFKRAFDPAHYYALDPRHYYLPGRRVKAPDDEPHHPHPDSRVITRSMYWAAGGSNEDLCGIYGGGNEFVARLRDRFRHGIVLPDVALRVYNLGGEDIGGVPAAGVRLPRKGGPYHWKGKPELRTKMQRAYLSPPKDHLRFEWTRVI